MLSFYCYLNRLFIVMHWSGPCHLKSYTEEDCKQRLFFHFAATQTRIITQKLYSLQHCLTNGSSLFLDSSYILNQPVSINLCIASRLWLTGVGLLLLQWLHGVSLTTFFLPAFSLVFPPTYILPCHRPKKLLH